MKLQNTNRRKTMKHIVIDPRVVKHLGQDLITSSDVAVTELIKNSIDAKAKTVNLRIYNSKQPKNLPSNPIVVELITKYSKQPMLLIEDDGVGMSDQIIEEGFLKVGTDIKANNDDDSFGEKGIGRLATQRLGSSLLVETATKGEDHTSYIFIDWESVISGKDEVLGYEGSATKPHTKLWIFNINLEDYIDNAIQFNQLTLIDHDVAVQINRNLKSALNFLISPFITKGTKKPQIHLFFDDKELDLSFPSDLLNLAESIHNFNFMKKRDHSLDFNLKIAPWFIERIHRALVKPEAFNRLKKSHQFYSDLLTKNLNRINNVLENHLNEGDLFNLFKRVLEDLYAANKANQNEETFNDFLEKKASLAIEEIIKILPICGSIYSFKQGAAIGDKIIIDAAHELQRVNRRYGLQELKYFLEDYNGIKLYRKIYRIGFLGNKESDWIKLQQFRTKGQQWYRFDLGNTVGYVSLSDSKQKNIREISSRLDISENKTSEAFKLLINVIFNYLFYDLNRKANDIVKVILSEEGLLEENLSARVKKTDADLQEILRRNKRMQKALNEISKNLKQGEKIQGKNQVVLSENNYDSVINTLNTLDDDIKANSTAQEKAATLLNEAKEQLKIIEVESYNNYKLMANGLITETITHELHSLCKTGITPDALEHFEFLKDYFIQNRSIKFYNSHVAPIQNSYNNITGKLNQVGDLYSFLETTFIKKGSFDEFTEQNISDVITNIKENLKEFIKKENIDITCKTGDLIWIVPKGVLLHVFYNLINNSLYWIDVRRKYAKNDPHYKSLANTDSIVIENYSGNGIIVYDTGTGVSKNMEDILFEPLQSGKPLSEGRGMGLYIVKKLLNSFDGNIELLEERNQYGNRYKFLITNNASEA